MSTIVVLLALSAAIGFALGSFSWLAIAVSGVALAVLSSVALHIQGFSTFPGIAIVIACLTMNQIAYLASESLQTNVPVDQFRRRPARNHPGFSDDASL
jgi:hypothetical protein